METKKIILSLMGGLLLTFCYHSAVAPKTFNSANDYSAGYASASRSTVADVPNPGIHRFAIKANSSSNLSATDVANLSDGPSRMAVSDRVVAPSEERLYYQKPYSAICTIMSYFDRDGDGQQDLVLTFSGSMVGPDTVLTSEDKTYREDLGYPLSIRVVPGLFMRDRTLEVVKPFGETFVSAASRGNFSSTGNPNDNWALLYLSEKIGERSGWFDVDDAHAKKGDRISLAGQIDSRYYTYQSIPSTILEVSDYSFKYSPSYDPKSISLVGAPLLNEAMDTVYGIHCFRKTTFNGSTCRSACKVSHYIKNWVYQRLGAIRFSLFSVREDSSSGSIFGTGHTWISMKNETDSSIEIGCMPLKPGEAVTIGTWGNQPHKGIYYNLENLLNRKHPSAYMGRVSLTKYVKTHRLKSINQCIATSDYWELSKNCSYFGMNVWNTAFPEHAFSIPQLPTPVDVINQIQSRVGWASKEPVYGGDMVGYFSNGSFVPARIEG